VRGPRAAATPQIGALNEFEEGLLDNSPEIIGWREWIALPELGIQTIKAKVDTGARTSALHASQIRYLRKTQGETWISFVVTSQLKPHARTQRVRARLVERRQVRSSLGHATLRPVIRTVIQLGMRRWPVEITLVNRDPMGFRMLLGRQAVRRRFLIDPLRSFIQSKSLLREDP
jgi:hypothetical protein